MTQAPIPFFTLLHGDDTISRERARARHLEQIRAARGQVEVESWDPDRQSVAKFVERVLTPSLFGGTRVFTMKHADLLAEADLETLSQLLAMPLDDEYVLVEAETADRTNKAWAAFLRKADKKGAEGGPYSVVAFQKPPPWKIADWLVANTQTLFGRRISKTDAEHLVDLAGDDFDALRSELEKIDLFLDAGKPVTHEVITEVVEGTREAATYELAEALGKKDAARAIKLLDSLFGGTFYAPLLLGAIQRHFWTLMRIRAFAVTSPQVMESFLQAVRSGDRESQTAAGVAIGKAAGMFDEKQPNKVYAILIKGKMVEQARSFSDRHLLAIMRWLRDIDVGVKTGRVDPTKAFMQMFCVRVIQGPQAPGDASAYAMP